MVLCAAKSETICNHFDASIYMLAKNEGGRSKPIISKYTQMLFSRTWSIPCRVDLCKYKLVFIVGKLKTAFILYSLYTSFV